MLNIREHGHAVAFWCQRLLRQHHNQAMTSCSPTVGRPEESQVRNPSREPCCRATPAATRLDEEPITVALPPVVADVQRCHRATEGDRRWIQRNRQGASGHEQHQHQHGHHQKPGQGAAI